MANHSKNKRKRSLFWRIVFWFAILIFILCAGVLGYLAWTYWIGQKQYDDLKGYVNVEATLSDMTVDWDALRAINPDICGWIYVPDTPVSYPICWKEGDDSYYLYHNFNNRSTQFGAEYGCIFLSGQNKKDWSDNSNLIYGHNMLNGTQFSIFSAEQGNSEWFNAHRTIYILTPDGNYKLDTYAQNKVSAITTDIVYTSFPNSEEIAKYVDARKASSLVEVNPVAKQSDKIDKLFTLSTCSSPDDNNRILTLAEKEEFVESGSDSSTKVDNSDVEAIQDDANARQNQFYNLLDENLKLF